MYVKYINFFGYFNIINYIFLNIIDKNYFSLFKVLFNKYIEHIIIDNMFFFLTLLSIIYFSTSFIYKIVVNIKKTIVEGIKIKNKFNERKKKR